MKCQPDDEGYARHAMSVIEQLVDQIEARFADAEREMGDPQVITDRDRYAAGSWCHLPTAGCGMEAGRH